MGLTPNSPGKTGPGTVGLPIVCGGRPVASGDIIVGDEDAQRWARRGFDGRAGQIRCRVELSVEGAHDLGVELRSRAAVELAQRFRRLQRLAKPLGGQQVVAAAPGRPGQHGIAPGPLRFRGGLR